MHTGADKDLYPYEQQGQQEIRKVESEHAF